MQLEHTLNQLTNQLSTQQSNALAPQIAVVYHSPYGHTQKVAQAIAQGVILVGCNAVLVDVKQDIPWAVLDKSDVLVFGSPTYLGSVTAGFKQFMDGTGQRWKNRSWQGKLAAGFTNSGGLSGDKLAVLQHLNLFAMQHGMLWTGLPLLPEGCLPHHKNRLSSCLGLMTQSDDAPIELTPPQGDIDTAIWFGEYIGQVSKRLLSVVSS